MSAFLLAFKRVNLWHFVWIAVVLSVLLSLLLSQLIHGQILLEYPFAATFIAFTVALLLISLIKHMRGLEQALAEHTGHRVQDVIERRRTEDALRESQEQFGSAFRDAAIGMALVGTDGRWLQVNPALCELVGYTEQELLASTFQAITHPDDLDIDLAFVRQMLTGEIRTYQMEKRYFHKQGQIVWILLSVSLVHDPFGQPLYFISQIQDITERKQVQEKLRESEARFRAILDNSPAMIFLKDTEGHYLLVNRQFERIFHLDQKTIVGKTDVEIFSPRQAAAFQANDRKVIQGGIPLQFEFEEEALHDDGPHTSIVFKFPLRTMDGNLYGIGGITTDITERKQAEEALRKSEARYRQLIELSQDAIYVLDDQGTFTMTNPAGCTLLGYTEQELVGLSVVNTYRAEERPAVAERLQQLKMGELLRFERVAVRKNGTTVPIEVCLSPMTHGHCQAVVRDITDRKRVEDELLALKDDLATEVMAMGRLHEFSTRLVTSTELQPLLEEVLTATIALQDADFGNVQLYNPHTQALEIVSHRGFQQDFLEYFSRVHDSHSACGRALQQQERVIIEDVHTDPRFEPHRPIAASAGFCAVQSTPLFSRSGESLGMISTHFRQAHRPSARELRLTDLYARQAAEMIERKRGEEALRDSEQRLRQALDERERLSQDLHDHVIQSIYAIGMALESCHYLMEKDPGLAARRLQSSIADLNGVMKEVRTYIEWASPTLTSSDQLREALEDLVRTIPSARPLAIRLEIDPSTGGQLTAEEATHVLQIAREAVSNSLRHSGAKTGAVSLCKTDGGLRLEVRDDGGGFDTKSGAGHGLGLRNMAARASKLGATLTVRSERGRGTQIILDIPKDHHHASGPSAIDPAAAR
jgi:PAS domain S-box-containing protein